MKKAVTLLLSLLLVFCLVSCDNDNEKDAYKAVKEHYDDVEIIEIVPVYSHGEKTDTACIASTSEGIIAGELYISTSSYELEFEPRILLSDKNGYEILASSGGYIRDIFKAMVSDRLILHGFSDKKEGIREGLKDESLEIIEFEIGGKTFYYYVVYLD